MDPKQRVNILYFTVRRGKKDHRSGKTQEIVISFSQAKRNFNRNTLGSPNAWYCVHSASETESKLNLKTVNQ